MTTGRFFRFVLFTLFVAGLGYGASYLYQYPIHSGEPPEETEVGLQDDLQTQIEAQGRLEPTGGTISVSALPGEEIVQLNVHIGQDVKAGDDLAILGSQKIRQAEYQLAISQEEQARAKLASELALSDQRIKAAELAVQQAESRKKELPPEELKRTAKERRELAFQQFQKLQQLRNNPATRDAISEAQLEQQRLLISQLDAEMLQSQNTIDVAITTQQLAVQAAELDSTIAQLAKTGIQEADPSDMLHQTADLAKLVAEATSVKAPCSGKILEIYARQGERVANTPILVMGNLDDMICVAEVHEANLKEIEVEENDGRLVPVRKYPVTIKSVAINGDLQGEVVEVGRLIGAPKLRDPNPLARSDLRTAQVSIKLDDKSKELAKRFVHLQVNVTIHLKTQGSDANANRSS